MNHYKVWDETTRNLNLNSPAKSSTELMGVTIRFTVRTAAKLAVYEEMRMSVKNHQTVPTIRPAVDLF